MSAAPGRSWMLNWALCLSGSLSACADGADAQRAGPRAPSAQVRAPRGATPRPPLEPPPEPRRAPPQPVTVDAPDAAGPPAPPACDCPPGRPDFATIFEEVAPSVVSVVAGDVRSAGFEAVRQGSGFMWDDAGHIVTNDHIVDGVTAFQIRTADQRELTASLVGRDPRTDLAVLQLEGGELSALARVEDPALRPGEWVAAIGSPYGFDHSITVGVVSALGRRHLPAGAPRYANFIQTDASINPGNSGGPLVDGQGRAVGVTTSVLGEGQGVSFATPIEMVSTVVERILADGRFVRGFAGLYVETPSLEAAAAAGLRTRRGALVSGVVMEAPAHKAGLEPGDIVLAYAGHPIEDRRMLSWLLAATRPGQATQIRVARGRQRLNFMLVVEPAPGE